MIGISRLPQHGYQIADFLKILSIGSLGEGRQGRKSASTFVQLQEIAHPKAAKGSTGALYLRYELNGKRVWESLTTRTYTFALAAARTKESSLLLGEATPPKLSPAAPTSFEELRTAFIHDKKTTFRRTGRR